MCAPIEPNQKTTGGESGAEEALAVSMHSEAPLTLISPLRYVFRVMVGMARCAVPARVVAGGTNDRAALAFEGVAPLHAARTSQRDVPTTLNT